MTNFTKIILISIILVTTVLLIAGRSEAATITVNSNADNTACDSSITYREAIMLANSDVEAAGLSRPVTAGERDLISGVQWGAVFTKPFGCPTGIYWRPLNWYASDSFDYIKFNNSVSVINILAPLPTLTGLFIHGEEIDGKKPDGTKVILDGTSAGAGAKGVDVAELNYNVLNLEIRNFNGDGVTCTGCFDSLFRGLVIHDNGGNGIHLMASLDPVYLKQARGATIGGTGSDQGNVIFRNGADGINITLDPRFDRNNQSTSILNNLIGTHDGFTDDGNNGRGITLANAIGVTIGDSSGLTKNTISGNNNDGIAIEGSSAMNNVVIWNNIGTDINGGARLGNGASGVSLLNDAGSGVNFATFFPNRIGMPGLPNVISANSFGIFIADPNTSTNIVQGNYIGTNIGGNTDLGNNGDGIFIVNGTFDNKIGGSGAGEANVIAFNASGIHAVSGVRNLFQRNRIFSNDNLGIDLGNSGATPNDPGDADSGANNLQNFPVITSVNEQVSSTNIQGILNSTPNQNFTIDFYGNTSKDASNFGEGRNFIGFKAVTTDANGNASFNVTYATSVSQVGSWISATATDSQNNTSEFSMVKNICAQAILTPSSVFAFSNGGPTSFNVSMSSPCTFTAQTAAQWIKVNSVIGSTVNISIFANHHPPRTGRVNVFYNDGELNTFVQFTVFQNLSTSNARADFNGDFKSDLATFRPSESTWYIYHSENNTTQLVQGLNAPGDILTPSDFDGDGKTDAAVFRSSIGQWFIVRSSDSMTVSLSLGVSGDKPVAGDYDGDGKADEAVYRPSDGTWRVLRSSTGTTTVTTWGLSTDIPVQGDYDGDGRTDLAVYRPSTGVWFINGTVNGVMNFTLGNSTDKPVPGDYDGDGKDDVAVFRPSDQNWYSIKSSNGQQTTVHWGLSTDVPVPGDYDGDGKCDQAVFRDGTWLVFQSATSTAMIANFGLTGDVPIETKYIP